MELKESHFIIGLINAMHDSFHQSKKYMILRGDNFQIENLLNIARFGTWYLSIKQPYVVVIFKVIIEGKQYKRQAELIFVAYAYII